MTLSSHVASLEAKHSSLETMIEEEIHRPAPDTIRLRDLKKQKLLIKEELSRLTAH